jgi:hypothetical protein
MGDLRPVTVGAIGTGAVTADLVCAALNDTFAYGPEDDEGYFAPSDMCEVSLLLCANDDIPAGLQQVWQWGLRCELRMELYTAGDNHESITVVAETLDGTDLHKVVASPVTDMLAALGAGENPLLLVISEDGVLDEDAEWAAARALEKDIPVFDLSRAVLQLDWDDLPHHEAPEPVQEEPDGQLALVVDDGPETMLTASEVRTINDVLGAIGEFALQLRELLANGIDDLLADINKARAVLAPRAAEPEEKTSKRASRQYLEVFDEATGEWKRAGRGRPKKGAQTRLVPANS